MEGGRSEHLEEPGHGVECSEDVSWTHQAIVLMSREQL